MVDVADMIPEELTIVLESISTPSTNLCLTLCYLNLFYIMMSIIMIDDFNCNMTIVLSRRKECIKNGISGGSKEIAVRRAYRIHSMGTKSGQKSKE